MACSLTHDINCNALKPHIGGAGRGIYGTDTVHTVPHTYLLLWRLARCWRYFAF